MKKIYQPIACMVFLLIQVFPIHAHDFWLEPQVFYSKVNQLVDINIRIGTDFVGEEQPNIPAHYEDFSYTSIKGRLAIDAEMGRYPAGYFKTERQGTYVVGYRSSYKEVKLNGEKFTAYLKQEGLDHIINYRKQHQQSNKQVLERYSRCAKTLVKIGDKNELDFSQTLFNCTLELIPKQNPYLLRLGDSLNIKVLMDKKPLENTLVIAFTKNNPQIKQTIRTDKQGNAKIKLLSTGTWIIKTVAMIPYTKASYDWESFWASLTFKLK